MTQETSFKNQTVIITGGSRGLGLALARELASQGARLCLLARDPKELSNAKGTLQREFPEVSVDIFPCDITDRALTTQIFKRIENQHGEISMLINDAGAILVGPFDSMTDEDFAAQVNLHLFAVISTTRLVVANFRKNKTAGRIINICSVGGKIAMPHMLPYDTSKFALAGFSQGLTAELAPEKISVTTIYPTVIQTGSAIQAVFKGDHEKEFAWFATTDMAPGMSSRADHLAKRIIRAALDRKVELLPSFAAKLQLAAGLLFPQFTGKIMARIAGTMPEGQSKTYKTGAQSRALFDKTVPLKEKENLREKQFNQKPKTDAKFNLGLNKKRKAG